ncbi:MAG: hypothetical protein LCH84_09645 [Gemmatimonadetes bacterium]|nr:hypothetical protein [Gemmatimonadota bacterium]
MPDVRGVQRITVELPSPLRALLQLPDAPLALTVPVSAPELRLNEPSAPTTAR